MREEVGYTDAPLHIEWLVVLLLPVPDVGHPLELEPAHRTSADAGPRMKVVFAGIIEWGGGVEKLVD